VGACDWCACRVGVAPPSPKGPRLDPLPHLHLTFSFFFFLFRLSRFKAWPFLETFAMDALAELKAELGGEAPALIVGHYTDGGMVAGHLARAFGPRTSLCHVAHALEKTKYPQAALHWASKALSPYNFGCQFTADVLNINRADFIITSTYQEIAGAATEAPAKRPSSPSSPVATTGTSPGQYESMTAFGMPGLLRVVNAVVRGGGKRATQHACARASSQPAPIGAWPRVVGAGFTIFPCLSSFLRMCTIRASTFARPARTRTSTSPTRAAKNGSPPCRQASRH